MKQLKSKTKKFQNGITLIALVITIIVLLILAGVSIATLTGENGILTRANDAKTNTEIAEEREKVELSATAVLAEDLSGEIDIDKLRAELGKYFDDGKYEVEPGTNEDGTEGYVLADYVSDYTPNTTPAERIILSASSINMNQYKSVRLDGVSTPNVSLVWRSSNEDVVTVSTIRYSEGDESCIVYGKSPGTATVYCSDYAGTIQVECFVTVSEAEPVRFVYTEPNLVTSNTAMNLVAITDSQKTAVEFILEDNMGNQIANGEVSTPSVEENRNNKTNVFRFSVGTLSEGEYRVKIYSTDGIAKYEMKEDYVFIVHPFNADTVTTEEHRTISVKMIEVIMDYEAYSPTIYDDPLAPKHPTVGYGLVVNINESFYNNMTQREAKALLSNSIDSN